MIKYEVVAVRTRFELLSKIEAFLGSLGWQTVRKSESVLYATDSLGEGLGFVFNAYDKYPNSYIFASDSIDSSKEPSAQATFQILSYFCFKNNATTELSEAVLVGDDKNFALQANLNDFLLFIKGHLNKSHNFNGGVVAWSSLDRNNNSYSSNNHTHFDNYAFCSNSYTYFKIGGAWDLSINHVNNNQDTIKFGTNLIDFNRQNPPKNFRLLILKLP